MSEIFDFNNQIKFITENKIDLSNIKEQEKVLDSVKYNDSFQSIEKSLNLLYEKTRTIQDIINYTNTFIKSEIDQTISECKNILKDIENNRDIIKDSAYINYNVKLQSNFDTYSDRDNSIIKGVEMHNNVITLSNDLVENVIFDNILLESISKNYNVFNTIKDINSDNNYRSMYMFDRPQKEAIKEKIIINFSKVRTINKINIIPSNSKIKLINYVHEDGKIETVNSYNTNLNKNRNIKSIEIELECDNYIISNINYKDSKDINFWEEIEIEEIDYNKPKYYYYVLGLDNIAIQFCEVASKSCFISKDIKLEPLKDNEYLTLEAEYSCENGNIEFYVLDGTNEIPIIPEIESNIIQEQIFYKVPTRFTIDNIDSIKIYKDSIPTKITLNEAINSSNNNYTVSYKPKDATSIYNIKNNSIKVKAIIRCYDKNYIPYIKSIKLKKYGGDALWIDRV